MFCAQQFNLIGCNLLLLGINPKQIRLLHAVQFHYAGENLSSNSWGAPERLHTSQEQVVVILPGTPSCKKMASIHPPDEWWWIKRLLRRPRQQSLPHVAFHATSPLPSTLNFLVLGLVRWDLSWTAASLAYDRCLQYWRKHKTSEKTACLFG